MINWCTRALCGTCFRSALHPNRQKFAANPEIVFGGKYLHWSRRRWKAKSERKRGPGKQRKRHQRLYIKRARIYCADVWEGGKGGPELRKKGWKRKMEPQNNKKNKYYCLVAYRIASQRLQRPLLRRHRTRIIYCVTSVSRTHVEIDTRFVDKIYMVETR